MTDQGRLLVKAPNATLRSGKALLNPKLEVNVSAPAIATEAAWAV